MFLYEILIENLSELELFPREMYRVKINNTEK